MQNIPFLVHLAAPYSLLTATTTPIVAPPNYTAGALLLL
jgi:hypothetical protein